MEVQKVVKVESVMIELTVEEVEMLKHIVGSYDKTHGEGVMAFAVELYEHLK